MSIPQNFIDLIDSYGCEELAGLADALAGKPSVSVRVNPRKVADAVPVGTKRRVPWCGNGFVMEERSAFTFDPALHQGAFYVQDASSMFIGHVLQELTQGSQTPLKVLDACAAPGGKTTAIIDALPWGSLVVANEYEPKRAAVLRENLAKWGYPFTVVTQGDTVRFRDYPGAFDIVAADVPCSGEGMMRKDAVAVQQWSPALVEQCVERQRKILANLWDALRPGGYMIYSTCTFNRDENELMLEWLASEFGAEPVEIEVRTDWNIVPSIGSPMPACRFVPGRIEGEGLFMGVVRKPWAETLPEPHRKPAARKAVKARGTNGKQEVAQEVKRWLKTEAQWNVDGDRIIATLGGDELPLRPRIHVATVKGRDFIPSQELALSMALNAESFHTFDVGRETAVDYLRCEAVRLPDDAPKGIVLLTYGGLPLGFAKNLGSRANNFYPRNWRILSQRPAELPPVILSPQA